MVKRMDQDAVTPVIGVMLLVLLTALIAIIIYAFIYGIPGGLVKSAYVAAETGVEEINGTEFIAIQHRGGDAVFLNGSGATKGIPIDIRTAAGGGPVLAGADVPITWSPGEVLYLYNTADGPKITTDKMVAGAGTGFPAGILDLVIIDTIAEVLVFGSTLAMAGSGPGPDDPPVAGFTADPNTGPAPLTVQFTDTSTGVIDSWSWNFGDGNNSMAQSPSHTFTDPGTYTVTLTVANSGGSNSTSREIVVAPSVAGLTVEAWVKWNRDPALDTPAENDRRWATIRVDGTSDNNARYHLQHVRTNSAFEFAARNNQQRQWIFGTTAPQQGVWYYVVGVYEADFGDHGRLLIYVDGNSEGSNSFSSGTRGLKATTGTIQTGGPTGVTFQTQDHSSPWHNLRRFDGEIRGLGTYERAFTQAEIQARFNAGLP